MELGWPETAGLLALAVAVFILANLAERRPVDLLRPRLWSPVLVMAVAALVSILMLAHMLTLLTGTPFRGGGF